MIVASDRAWARYPAMRSPLRAWRWAVPAVIVIGGVGYWMIHTHQGLTGSLTEISWSGFPRGWCAKLGIAGRQAAANTGSAAFAQQLERSAERTNAFLHPGQAPAEHAIGWKADPVVGDIDDQLSLPENDLDIHRAGVGVAKNVGHTLLDHAINRLG